MTTLQELDRQIEVTRDEFLFVDAMDAETHDRLLAKLTNLRRQRAATEETLQ